MSELYINTNSSNTRMMSKTDLEKLPKVIRIKYRLASDSERKLHEDREGKKKVAIARRNKIEKQKAKQLTAKEAVKKEIKGSADSPKSADSNNKA